MRSVPYAYDNKLSSIKLNAWSVETRAPWERNGGGGWVGGSVGEGCQNTVIRIQMGPIDMTSQSRSDSAPVAGRGRERE